MSDELLALCRFFLPPSGRHHRPGQDSSHGTALKQREETCIAGHKLRKSLARTNNTGAQAADRELHGQHGLDVLAQAQRALPESKP